MAVNNPQPKHKPFIEQRLFIPKVEPEDLRDHFDRYEQEADRLRSIRTEIENMEREKKNLEIKKIEDNQKIDSEINFVDQKLKLKTDIYLRKLESQLVLEVKKYVYIL